MAFDSKALMDEFGIGKAISAALDAAYKLGHDDAIMNLLRSVSAATGVEMVQPVAPAPEDSRSARNRTAHGEDRSRAPRGLVKNAVELVVREQPGLQITDYERIVTEAHPEIAIKSIGNQLRSGEREGRFKRDRPGGYRWFPADWQNDAAGGTIVPNPPLQGSSEEGGKGFGT